MMIVRNVLQRWRKIMTAYAFLGVKFNLSVALVYLYEAQAADYTPQVVSPDISDDVTH